MKVSWHYTGMKFPESSIFPDVADNYGLFTPCSSHVLHPTFSMGQLFLISNVAFELSVPYLQWQPSGQHFAWALWRAADGDSAASATSSFLQCGFHTFGPSCHWWPMLLCCLECHPASNRRSHLSCGTPTTSLHMGLLQFSASSLAVLFGRALFYTDGRNGNCIQMGITAGALTRSLFLLPWGILSNSCSFCIFFFFTSVDFEVPSFSCLWSDLSQKVL